jgi:hypothetical protein
VPLYEAFTVTLMLVELQLVTVAGHPLKATYADPCVEPKFCPVMVKGEPTTPDVADKPVITGAASTVNVAGWLATPFTVTTTLADPAATPVGTSKEIVVEVHEGSVTAVPLKVRLKVL